MKSFYTLIAIVVLSVSFASPVQAKKLTNDKAKVEQKVNQSQTVNINKGNAEQLAQVLKGVGMKKAVAIIEYRQKHGKFKAVEEIASVKGIGVATIAKNYDRIKL